MTAPLKPPPNGLPAAQERKTQSRRKNGVDTRGMLSIVTMLVSIAALTASMVGASKMILDIFDDGLATSLNGVLVKTIVLGLAFFFGWGCGLASIRGFGNLVYPIVINAFAWICLIGVSLLYMKVIQKLYLQMYDALHFWAYLIILLGGLFVLICLHLLVEGHDLRPFAIPLLLISVLQLFVIVMRYVFTTDAKGWMVISDFTVFVLMVSISALMLMHFGILSPLRNWVDGLFHRKSENGNGDSAA